MVKHGKRRRLVKAALITLVGAFAPSLAAACSVALALTVDVSGSINEEEFRLQMDGLSAALQDPIVADAMVSANAAVLLVQWSGASRQVISVPWQRMLTRDDVATFGAAVASAPRAWSQFSTGIGNALEFTAAQFVDVADCGHKVIDVSGDGYSNEGPMPKPVATALAADGFQINGLAIEGNEFELTAYYKANVAAGEGAFVFTAASYADYPRAIWRKLLAELVVPLSWNHDANLSENRS